jgi:hypothetical protein
MAASLQPGGIVPQAHAKSKRKLAGSTENVRGPHGVGIAAILHWQMEGVEMSTFSSVVLRWRAFFRRLPSCGRAICYNTNR